jgi:hypothetical protein
MRPTVIGEIGRLLVSAELLKAGYTVSRPEVDVGYDLIATCPDGTSMKVQVKTSQESSTFSVRRSRHSSKQRAGRSGQQVLYTSRDVDAFAFVLLSGPDFWIVRASESLFRSHKVTVSTDSEWHRNWGALKNAP